MKYIILTLLLVVKIQSLAQCIEFSYDAAGDRIQRNICGQALQSPQKSLMTEGNDNYFHREKLSADQVLLAPNPTDGILDIKTPLFTSEGLVMITDILGRKHYVGKLGDGRLDLSFFYPGQYFVRISEGGIMRVVAVIKN